MRTAFHKRPLAPRLQYGHWIRAAIALIGMGFLAIAQDVRAASFPIVFHAEGGPLRTSACLDVVELRSEDDFSGEGHALRDVMAAFKSQDREALLALSDPGRGRDPERFDQQAEAFFGQFKTVELIGVKRAFAFDGFVLFFGELRYKERTLFAPFVFAYGEDGSLGFLPYRTEELTYVLMKDWFNALRTSEPSPLCGDSGAKSATHRVALSPELDVREQGQSPSHLMLTGAPIDKPGPLSDLVERVSSTVGEMKSQLSAGDFKEFAKHLTPEGGGRLTEWYTVAPESEQERYRGFVIDQQPFFLFDASPLVVVYTRTPEGMVQVMYFTSNHNGELLWTNSSHVTVADRIFKKGPLYNASLQEKPFSGIAVK